MTRAELMAQGLLMVLAGLTLTGFGWWANRYAAKLQDRLYREARERRLRTDRLKKWRGE